MKCEGKFSRRVVALCLVGISLLFLLPSSATAQRERENEYREDAAYEELIHHLEMGMVALEELGKGDALEMMARVANEVRAERKAARMAREDREKASGNDHERELARRLVKALRLTEKACREVERPDAGDLARHAYRALEMQLEGRRDEEARQYIEKAPPLGARIELLAMASELWADWGREEEAAFTREMADTLKEQWNRRVERQRREGNGDLESLERRIDILRFARDAFAEVGDQKNSGALTRAVRYGELILQGKTDDEELLAKAAEAVPSRHNLIEMLNWASARYREWGNEERSGVCNNLAEYYAQRLREERGEEEERHETEEHAEAAGDIENLEYRIEILHWARGALAEGGKREKAGLMERFIHVAELQQAGASGEQIGQAFEGLSMEMTIDLLELATELYADWNMGARARACHRLARYYSDREQRHEHESEAEHDHEHEQLHEEHAEDARRHQDYLILLQRLEDLQAELEEIRHFLHEQLER